MIFRHILLALFWMAYCLLHSILASGKLKLFLEKKFNNFFRYYRLSYSIFATVTLSLLLYFQFSFKSILIINSPSIRYAAFVLFILPGLLIMLMAIYKYFRLLSGVRSLYHKNNFSILRIDGIHRYMRHPLYTGTLLFTWGLFFIFPFVSNLIAVCSISGYVLIGIKFEEKKLVKEFGDSYTAYKAKVPKLIPNLREGICLIKKGDRMGHP